MKKMLLISAVASAVAFAGGDIAPVQPVQPTAAPAACDFWGSIGARYDAVDQGDFDFGDTENNTFTTAIVLGVEKDLGYGFGFGAEIAGIATTDGEFKNGSERGELSQAYLTYKNGNTAVKIGRQALPKSLSPWAWSDRTVGVLDRAYNGIVAVNTDLANTTLVGAWIHSFTDTTGLVRIDQTDGKKLNRGLFMVAAQYKGIENTTLTGSLYYVPKFLSTGDKAISAWGSVETKVSNVNLGLQVAYAKADAQTKSYGVAAYLGTSYEGLNAKLTLAYLNDGTTTLNLGGTSAFWGNSGYTSFGGDVDSDAGKQKIVRLDVDYKIDGYGTIYGGGIYDKADVGKAYGARVGYMFNIKGVDAKIEYRYAKKDGFGGEDCKKQTIRLEGVYKF